MSQRFKKQTCMHLPSRGKKAKELKSLRAGLLYQAYFFLFSKKRCEADVAKCYHLLNNGRECRFLLFFSLFSVWRISKLNTKNCILRKLLGEIFSISYYTKIYNSSGKRVHH